MTAASPCSIVASVASVGLPDGFLFAGNTGSVVDVVGVFWVGVLVTQVRQSFDSFMSSGQPHEVVGFVWLILIVLLSLSCVGEGDHGACDDDLHINPDGQPAGRHARG